MELLQDKKVLIIGGTGGIGEEAAKLIQKANAELYLTGRDVAKLHKAAERTGVPKDRCFELDVTQAPQVEALAKRLTEQFGALDVLVNAAGIGIIKPLEKLEPEEFAQVVQVNLQGAFHVMKYFLPPMKEKKEGLVINLPGVLGKVPMAGAAAYAASKYGLNGMVKSIREELRRTNVRITNLYLGGTDTPFWDDIDMRVNRDKFVTAREAGRAIWFLCQQPSSGVVSEMVLQPFNHQAI
jgi:NADP-dependent 3-hydroxy acid dehydrogenase YdfG